ncbi:MAG: CoA-binding protein [Planctomycetales bacterium]|nr:CoA-binding protein [Planctomycetales bacterium]
MSEQDDIREFLAGDGIAVCGASNDRTKYGNRVLLALREAGYTTYAVNPRGGTIEGDTGYENLAAIPHPIHAVSIIVPPVATLRIVEEAATLGIKYVWMQPGAESDEAIAKARELGLHTIANGPCVLVSLRLGS